MLPSDHFVMMYNELFKMLEERSLGDLRAYWLEISELQKTIIGPYIERDGLKGMYDYWAHIIEEENCAADMDLTEDYFEFRMHVCPSLTKNLDNDAGQCPHYCDHCAGWVEPVLEHFGYHLVYDMISRTEPRCRMRVYRDPTKANEYAEQVQLRAQPYKGDGL
jgi:hypothetical protein